MGVEEWVRDGKCELKGNMTLRNGEEMRNGLLMTGIRGKK